MLSLMALTLSGISVGQWAIYAIVLCGIVAIVLIAMTQMGIVMPPFVVKILWVIFAVVVAVVAVRLLMSI